MIVDFVNIDRIILFDGYCVFDIVFGVGVYVVIGYIVNIFSIFSCKLFYFLDMCNWIVDSYVVLEFYDCVMWVFNRFYVIVMYENGGLFIISVIGIEDWVQ